MADHRQQGLDDRGVELLPGVLEQLLHRHLVRQRAAVRPVRAHRVPRVAAGDDARLEWDLVAELFGESFGTTNVVTRIVYGLVGLAGIYLAVTVLPTLLRSDSRVPFDNPSTTS